MIVDNTADTGAWVGDQVWSPSWNMHLEIEAVRQRARKMLQVQALRSSRSADCSPAPFPFALSFAALDCL